MPLTRAPLAVHRAMQVRLDRQADQTARDIVQAWSRAWQEVADEYAAAIDELIKLGDGGWPSRRQIARAARAQKALKITADQIRALTDLAGVTVAETVPGLIDDATEYTKLITAAQLPDGYDLGWSRVDARAVRSIVNRTTRQMTAATRPLAPEAQAAMRSALVRGVNVGSNPRVVARDMLRRVEGVFNGGRPRAVMIATTELADAHRESARQARMANPDTVAGWTWIAELSPRTCPACLRMHGTEHATGDPGPFGHQACRCTAAPRTVSWADLGIDLDEPDDDIPNAQAWFDDQPADVQRQIMGPARLAAYRSGRLPWDQMAVRRQTDGWRDSWVPRPVR